MIERLEPVEQWFWVRDGMFGEWEYNRHANPGQPVLAYFEFSPVASDQTRQVVSDAVDLSKAELKVDAAEVAEKTGYRLEEGEVT